MSLLHTFLPLLGQGRPSDMYWGEEQYAYGPPPEGTDWSTLIFVGVVIVLINLWIIVFELPKKSGDNNDKKKDGPNPPA